MKKSPSFIQAVFRPCRTPQRGVALVVTLTFLVIITILVVAFFSGVNLDRQAGGATANLVKQRLLADSAVAHAVSLLAENIPSPNYNPVDPAVNTTFTNWWVNPGRLTTQTNTQAPNHVELYTTAVAGQSAGTVDLNARLFNESEVAYHPVEPGGAPLDVSWVEVLRDPASPRQSNRGQPNYNPVIGRYAFWIDSETNKINFTTALGIASQSPALSATSYDPQTGAFWPVGNESAAVLNGKLSGDDVQAEWIQEVPFSLGLPSMVGYSGLVGANRLDNSKIFWNQAFNLLNTMDKGVSGTEPFDPAMYHPRLTPRSIKAFVASADAEAFWNDNRFMLTHRSWSPEFNAFGKPRFLQFILVRRLNDQPNLLSNYQVPVRKEMLPAVAVRHGYGHTTIEGFPGNAAEHYVWMVGYYKAYQEALGAYLQYDWPGIGASFLDKWKEGSTYTEADALAEIDQFVWSTQTATASMHDWANRDYTPANVASAFPKPVQGGQDFEGLAGDYRIHDFWNGAAQGGSNIMGRALPPGFYSQRGMNAATPMPFLNEIGMEVTPRAKSATSPGVLHLEFSLNAEFFLPPGYSYGTWAMNVPTFRTNYLEYKISKNGGPAVPVVAVLNQGNNAATPAVIEEGVTHRLHSNTRNTHYLLYSNPGIGNNGSQNVLNANSRITSVKTLQASGFASAANNDSGGNVAVYFAHNNGATPGQINNLIPFAVGDSVNITDIRIRMVLHAPRSSQDRDAAGPVPRTAVYYAVIPNRGRPGVSTTGLTPADTIDGALVHLPDVSMTDIQPGEASDVKTVEINDPRLNVRAESWVASADPSGENSLGSLNPGYDDSAIDTTKLAWNNPDLWNNANDPNRHGNFSNDYPLPAMDYPFTSTGYLFTLSTGIQRGIPWKTVDLSETMASASGMPPDYLLLDLFAMSTDYTRMHATEGKININTKVYPESFGQNLDRGSRVLRSAVENLQLDGTAINSVTFANEIIAREPADGYAFSGQFMEAPSLDMGQTTEYGKQLLRARIANIFTNKSNTFTVHGVVETVTDQNGTLRPTSRRAFQAMVEREIFPGRDGIYGNGFVDSTGTWTKIGNSRGRNSPGDPLDVIDGPDSVNLPMPGDAARNETPPLTPPAPLEDAYNPALPYYRYQVLNLSYLNE